MTISHKQVAESIIFGEPNVPSVVHRVQEVTDDFYFNKGISSDDGEQCLSVDDPIYMLFNQQRLNQLSDYGDDIVKSWLDEMKKGLSVADPLRDLRSKMSDDDIIQCVRSRHIQSPNDLRAWADYCNRSVDNFKSELQSAKDKYEQEQAQLKEKESVTVNT